MRKKSRKKEKAFERFRFVTARADYGWEEQVFPCIVLLPLTAGELLGKRKRLGKMQEQAGLWFSPKPLPRELGWCKAEPRDDGVSRERA